jgi:hypothetical protein
MRQGRPAGKFEREDAMSKRLERNATDLERIARDKIETIRRAVSDFAETTRSTGEHDPVRSRRLRHMETVVFEYIEVSKALGQLRKKMRAKRMREEAKAAK